MARPNKQGVDYFPLDVHLDDKVKFVEIKYKLEGFAIVIKLMQRIYAQSYWCKWSEDETLLFSDEIKSDFNLVENVVNECLRRGVFDNILYEKYGVLTSKGIQKRYKEIVRRRKGVEVIEDYLLIDNDFGINDDINPSEGKRNDSKSTQSKVNKTKLNKIKQQQEEKQNVVVNPFNFYQDNFGVLTPFISQDIDEWTKDLSDELIIEAMKIALQSNKPWKYASGILKDWFKHNLRSLDDVQAYNKQYESNKARKGTVKSGTNEDARKFKEDNNLPF